MALSISIMKHIQAKSTESLSLSLMLSHCRPVVSSSKRVMNMAPKLNAVVDDKDCNNKNNFFTTVG